MLFFNELCGQSNWITAIEALDDGNKVRRILFIDGV